MSQSEGSRQGADIAVIARCHILEDFNLPVVLIIANSEITVTGYFLLALGNRGGDVVGVQIPPGLRMNKANDITVSNETRISLRVIVSIMAVRVEEPFVIGIFVMVTCDLLLIRALGIGC